jgi:elongation factor G
VYLVEVAISPTRKADGERLVQAVVRICKNDPSLGFHIRPDAETVTLKADTEERLEMATSRIVREFAVQVVLGAPQVAYRETITRTVEHDYTHKKQTGGSGQFARVKIRFEPGTPGSGFEFENEVVGGAVPKEYVLASRRASRRRRRPVSSPASRSSTSRPR